MPDNFKQWQEANAKRIQKAKERGTLPHWYRDNESFIEYYNHDQKKWEKTAYYHNTKGYLVRNKTRIQKGDYNKNERDKLEKETRMGYTSAIASYKIEMLEEVPDVPSPGVLTNGVKAEVKSVTNYKTIVQRARKPQERRDRNGAF